MKVLFIIFLIGLYLVVGRVIVISLNKNGYISDEAYDFFLFFTYVFLPLTLFIVGIMVVSDYIVKILKIDTNGTN